MRSVTFTGAIILMVVGLLIGVPYCFLAGWSTEYFLYVFPFSPVLALIWIILAVIARVLSGPNHKNRFGFSVRQLVNFSKQNKRRGELVCLWLYTGYITLPITVNFVSIVMRSVGYGNYADVAYSLRYKTLLFVFILVVATSTVACMFSVIYRLFKSESKQSKSV